MRTRIIIFFTLLLQLFSVSTAPATRLPEEYTVSPFVESIALRMCCVARVGPIIKFLQHLRLRLHDQQILQLLDDGFFNQWNDFSQFRFIADHNFQRLFFKSVFEALYLLIQKKNVDWFYEYDQKMIAYWLDDLTLFISEVESTKDMSMLQDSNGSEEISISPLINTNTVTDRFYVIRRLKKVFYVVRQLHAFDIIVFDKLPKKIYPIDPLEELSIVSEHPCVQDVIQRMITEKNLAPLIDLFSEVQRFKYVNDERFFQETLMTIFAAYKRILLSDQFSGEHRIEIEDELDTILHLYENLETLSTDELLTSIDMATDHMGMLFQEIEQDKNAWFSIALPSWSLTATLAVCATTAAYLLGRYR